MTAGHSLSALHDRQDEAIRAARACEPPAFEGQGIVMVAGGPRCYTNAYVALTILRSVLDCRLPIQIWYLGPDEMSPEMARILRKFDVDLVDALAIRKRIPVRRLGPWECKAFAILHSPFRHVLLLDADNMPLREPSFLFQSPEYADHGAIFWPDNQSHLEDSPVWELFRVPYRQELEVESGQLVIDKVRCWIALNLALHFNEWSDIYYQYIYGDKETFHFAWRHLGQSYAMPDGRPRINYCYKETPRGIKRMTGALEHVDFSGRPLFHHRTGAEWVLFGQNHATSRSDLERRCLAALAELRRQWDGRVAPDAPAADGIEGRDIIATRRFRYRRVGVDERLMTLEPDGCIGQGAGPQEQQWRLDGREHDRTLVISGNEGDTCVLKADDHGTWRGAWLWFERTPVELVPVG